MTDMSWMPWVVGGVMVLSFLYMKVWPFVRTIIRAFRGPRFKSKSKLLPSSIILLFIIYFLISFDNF